MIKEAECEFENAKEYSLKIVLDLKKENKYSFLYLEKKLVIISDEYKDSFESIEIEKEVYLKNEDNYIIDHYENVINNEKEDESILSILKVMIMECKITFDLNRKMEIKLRYKKPFLNYLFLELIK